MRNSTVYMEKVGIGYYDGDLTPAIVTVKVNKIIPVDSLWKSVYIHTTQTD